MTMFYHGACYPFHFLIFLFLKDTAGLELTTRAKNPLGTADALQDFLARPIHWPQIVASSDQVVSQTINVMDVLQPGQTVDEKFGLGLLSVQWTCTASKPGLFVVQSPTGVPGIAKDCSMTFDISNDFVDLTMGYVPESPLAYLATPILVVDNWLALNVLLPAAIDPTPLDSFRKLMGTLYGIAGLAHAADLTIGGSLLFTSFGLPPFENLPLAGQIFAILWCAVGPLAYVSSRTPTESGKLADIGLLIYGLVEVSGAVVSGNQEASINAVGVQLVIMLAWLYSRQKQMSRQNEFVES